MENILRFFEKHYRLICFLLSTLTVLCLVGALIEDNPFVLLIVAAGFCLLARLRLYCWKHGRNPIATNIDSLWLLLHLLDKEEKYERICFYEALSAISVFAILFPLGLIAVLIRLL